MNLTLEQVQPRPSTGLQLDDDLIELRQLVLPNIDLDPDHRGALQRMRHYGISTFCDRLAALGRDPVALPETGRALTAEYAGEAPTGQILRQPCGLSRPVPT